MPRSLKQAALGGALVLVLCSVGLTLLKLEGDLREEAVTAPGTVVGNVRRAGEYHAVVRFQDREGHVQTATVEAGAARALYDPGARVAVLYDPRSPGVVRIDTLFARYGLPLLLAVVAVFAAGVFVVRPLRLRAAPAPRP